MIRTVFTILILSISTLALADTSVLKTKDAYEKDSKHICYEKWNTREVTDTRMMAHCLNQEIEGIKDVMYYREK